MGKFFPIDAGVSFESVRSDVLRIDWGTNHFAADFVIPDDEASALRVSFDGMTIVRLIDEMPLSFETEPARCEGLVANHFAYRVEGGAFAESQAGALEAFPNPVHHYEFVTGWGCVDVLSSCEPSFRVVKVEG